MESDALCLCMCAHARVRNPVALNEAAIDSRVLSLAEADQRLAGRGTQLAGALGQIIG